MRKKTDDINAGRSYIVDVTSENVKKCVDDGKLTATTDFSKLAECDVDHHLRSDAASERQRTPTCPTSLTAGGEIQKYMRRGQLIILESTTYPGTTDEVLQPMFEEKGFKLDRGFSARVFARARRSGQSAISDTQHSKGRRRRDRKIRPRSRRCFTARSSSRCIRFRRPASPKRAKLWENTFRAINIGMANEMAKLCNALGIDTWEVVRAAATKPFGFMPFYPGPGIGGHCIPLDPHYLSWKARQHGFDSQFISLAEQVNSTCRRMSSKLVSTALNDDKKAVNGSKILILGVAYKKDIDDMRESPALSIIDLLRADGADVYLSRSVRSGGDVRPRLHDRRRRAAS